MEEIKRIQTGKEEVKLSLFADEMILHLKDSKDSTKNFLAIINTFSREAGYNIVSSLFSRENNIQASVLFPFLGAVSSLLTYYFLFQQ
jgi:Fic family protein